MSLGIFLCRFYRVLRKNESSVRWEGAGNEVLNPLAVWASELYFDIVHIQLADDDMKKRVKHSEIDYADLETNSNILK